MNFDYTPKVQALREKLLAFFDEHIYPNEHAFYRGDCAQSPERQRVAADRTDRATETQGARRRPVESVPAGIRARRRTDEPRIRAAVRNHGPRALGAGSVQLQRARHRQHGNDRALRQRGATSANGSNRCCKGQIRSAFLMTEPEVASSDATNIQTSIVRDGDYYVINGRKWWSSGAGDPRCKVYIVMGKTDPDAPTPPAAVDDPRSRRRHRHHRASSADRVRLRRRAARSYGNHARERARAGHQHAARRRPRLRDRARPPRTGTHPPLHAPDRPRRARARTDVRSARCNASRSASRLRSKA